MGRLLSVGAVGKDAVGPRRMSDRSAEIVIYLAGIGNFAHLKKPYGSYNPSSPTKSRSGCSF